eukprot:2714524-Karenia_brevis.AAC.1
MRPAVCKTCQTSKVPQVHQCTVCEASLPAEHHTDSMWHHRKQQPAVCKTCQASKVPEVHQCRT